MVTVRDILSLDVFSEAEIVAGQSGLIKEIRWVHIVSMPEHSEYQWTKGGEIVLTVGYNLHKDPQAGLDLVRKLVAHQVAGLVVSIGHYLDKVPTAMCNEADKHHFPIIELPGDVLFVDVSKAIFEQIVNQQYVLQQKIQDIYSQLMQVVLEGGTLQNLVEALSDYLNKSITIETSNFEVLADVQIGPIDEARQRSVETGRSSAELIKRMMQEGVYDRLLATHQPERIPPDETIGMSMERIVAPIIVDRNLIGYMWIIGDVSALAPLDELAIGQAATVAALFMYKERAVYEKEMSLRGDFLNLLLASDGQPNALLEMKADNVGFELRRNYQVIIFTQYNKVGESIPLPAQQVENTLLQYADSGHPLVVSREKQVIVILQTRQTPEGEKTAKTIIRQLSSPGHRVVAGVGRAVYTPSTISTSYEQAREALMIARSLHDERDVLPFDSLGMLHWLQQIPSETLDENVYYQSIVRLAEKDKREKKELLKSLESFLKHGGIIKEAAGALFIHRNTMIYRLEGIERFTRLNLKDPDVRLNLSVALHTYRLRVDDYEQD